MPSKLCLQCKSAFGCYEIIGNTHSHDEYLCQLPSFIEIPPTTTEIA